MGKRKQDPSKAGLSSPNIEGQGTTNEETGKYEVDSSRKKQRGFKN
ncbi:YuzL family protein [Bacillus solimangrovi]|nr:YuzL family protein [Bacillus solimangrovi]